MTPVGVFFCWWGGAERDFVNSAKMLQDRKERLVDGVLRVALVPEEQHGPVEHQPPVALIEGLKAVPLRFRLQGRKIDQHRAPSPRVFLHCTLPGRRKQAPFPEKGGLFPRKRRTLRRPQRPSSQMEFLPETFRPQVPSYCA